MELHYLTKSLRWEAQKALKAIRNEYYSSTQARVVSIPNLSETQLMQTFKQFRRLEYAPFKVKALAALSSRLPAARLEALELAQKITDRSTKVEALIALSFQLTAAVTEALKIIQTIEEKNTRIKFLADIMPHLSSEVLQNMLQEELSNENKVYRTKLLIELASHWPLESLQYAIQIAKEIEDTSTRTQFLTDLAAHLSKARVDRIAPFWREFMQWLSERTRDDALADLATMAPIIYRMGNKKAIGKVYGAIELTGQWWP